MNEIKLKENIYWIGTIDNDLREFDVVLNTKWGTTYNSYLVIGSEKTAIVDTVKYTKIEEYLLTLQKIVDLKDVDYLIVNHAEPDHSGSISRLLEINPDLIIVGSNTALSYVKEVTNLEFKSQGIKEGDTLSLGNKTFSFINAIMLHWPDAMYSYLIEDKTIFTCDSFGAHYALDEPLQSNITDVDGYFEAFNYYFKHIFGPFKAFYLNAISKIEKLEIDLVCVGHGPILNQDPWSIINYSKKLCEELQKNENPLVVIPYVTSYGYTEILANEIEKILIENEIQVKKYNLTYASLDEVVTQMKIADGILVGSPTMLGDALYPIWNVLIRINPFENGIKKGSVFGSYGWSGEGITHIDARLKQLKMKTIPPFKLKFMPNENDFLELKSYVNSFVDLLIK